MFKEIEDRMKQPSQVHHGVSNIFERLFNNHTLDRERFGLPAGFAFARFR